MRMTRMDRILLRARSQDGVTMIIAMGVMLVTSLMVTATFLAARGDIHLSHTDTTQKEAYYAALAGVQEFEYQMQINPDYWETCAHPTNKLPQEAGSSYKVKILVASTAPTETKECSTSSPFKSVIQSSGAAANTFRIESLGTAGSKPEEHHTIIATFKVTGFLNYIYYTNHEDEDPGLYQSSKVCSEPNTYYPNTSGCQLIEFATGDAINGPMHTNDAACVGGSASFGRSGHTPPDAVEFLRGVNANCKGTGKYYTSTGSYIKGKELQPPKSDTSLETYATEENEFTGTTQLVLNGSTSKIEVTNDGTTKTIAWPSNGLIFVKSPSTCGYKFSPHEADGAQEAEEEKESVCANVYVHGTYSMPLTIGSGNDVIINGNTYPTGNLGGEPTGTATLGLIANNVVRIYHPVGETYKLTGTNTTCNYNGYTKGTVKVRDPHFNGEEKTCEYTNNETEGCDAPNLNEKEDTTNHWGSLENPWIYAAILATTHSFVVDNYNCGAKLGNLNLYGALAQNYRGIVGTGGGTGYLKDYKYDERLAVDEPPYFLNPLNAGWKVSRETSPSAG
jgi:Tfp pilus assembly protein PilX